MFNVPRPLTLILAASLSACGSGDGSTDPTAEIAKVTVTAATSTLAPGQSTQLVANASTADGQAVSDAAFTWQSETPAVATVNGVGRVDAISPGTAVLAATAGTVRGTVTITVQQVPVASVTITPGTADVFVGSTIPVTAQARDAANTVLTGRTITWTTDNAAVATVSGGVITGVATGTTTISATSEGRTATATVSVSKRPLASIVDSMRLAWNMPAMGAAIVTLEDGLTAIAAAGNRRVTGGASVTTDDLWHLGSNTKAMTSMLAALAVSQGRIQWTTTLEQVFPELANIRDEYSAMTLRELLSHQSGFPRDPTPGAIGGGSPATQRASALAWAVQQPPASARGAFTYSNLGYIIAGAMLERVFGTSYEAAVHAGIFGPLGMSDAGWGPQAGPGSTTQPVAHRLVNGSWQVLEVFDIPPVNASSGTMHMSLTSWGRFLREVLRVEAGTSTIAPAAVARETTSAVITTNAGAEYGMGWFLSTRPWANGKVVYHDGNNTGNHSLTYLAPLRNVAFLVTTNGFDFNGRSFQAINALLLRLVNFHDTGH